MKLDKYQFMTMPFHLDPYFLMISSTFPAVGFILFKPDSRIGKYVIAISLVFAYLLWNFLNVKSGIFNPVVAFSTSAWESYFYGNKLTPMMAYVHIGNGDLLLSYLISVDAKKLNFSDYVRIPICLLTAAAYSPLGVLIYIIFKFYKTKRVLL